MGSHVFVFADELAAALPPNPTEEQCKVKKRMMRLIFAVFHLWSQAHEFMAFGGAGARACPGKSLAVQLLIESVRAGFVLGKPVAVDVGHRFSGRQRDGEDQSVVYFVLAFLKVLGGAIVHRIQTK